MKLPPIFLPDEEHSLVQILQACACEQSALAAYADAETKKLNALIARLEEYGPSCLSPRQAAEVRRTSTATVQATHDLHTMIRSKLQVILEKLHMEPLYNLTTLSPGYCFRISAQGAGMVKNSQDCHNGGKAVLSALQINGHEDYVESGSVNYMVESTNSAELFEAVGNGMQIGFFSLNPSHIHNEDFIIALITGFGIATQHTVEGIERGMAWFALTVWDCGRKSNLDKFRMLILSDSNPCLNHDSGIIG